MSKDAETSHCCQRSPVPLQGGGKGWQGGEAADQATTSPPASAQVREGKLRLATTSPPASAQVQEGKLRLATVSPPASAQVREGKLRPVLRGS